MISKLKKDLQVDANPDKAAFYPRFFKAGPGEYAEGDRFIGVTVPNIRKVAKQYRTLPLTELHELLKSPIHEHRLCALIILVHQYTKGGQGEKERIVRLYTKSFKYINNWDLVDSSAPYILGPHLYSKSDRSLLDQLASSNQLWPQRAAMLTTYYFIKQGDFHDTLRLAEKLLTHPHDLIHKAVGWMLREVGNRNLAAEEQFLKRHYKKMPRTALRYAIEKFPKVKRQRYLKGTIK